MNEELSKDDNIESKGFMAAVSVTDFPIRDHRVSMRLDVVVGLILVPGKVSLFL
jgi:hypothetical protein